MVQRAFSRAALLLAAQQATVAAPQAAQAAPPALQAVAQVAPAAAQGDAPPDLASYFDARRAMYRRVVAIGDRLARQAHDQCPDERAAGLVLDHPRQYTTAALTDAGFDAAAALPRVLAVAPGSSAATAGLQPGDQLLTISDQPLAPAVSGSGVAALEVALARLRSVRADAPVALLIQNARSGRRTALLPAVAGCDVWFDLEQSHAVGARARRGWIQLSEALVARFDDDALAFVVGHELGHHVLRRANRVRGMRAERQADAMAVVWMRDAGYDPNAALRVLAVVRDDRGVWDRINGLHRQLGDRIDRIAKLLKEENPEPGQSTPGR